MVYDIQRKKRPVLLLSVRMFLFLNLLLLFVTKSEGLARDKMRPILNSGSTATYLYGKLQRAESLFGSGLLPPVVIADGEAKSALEKVLWNQFGMATLSGGDVVDREDVLGSGGFMVPVNANLQDTLVFLDATREVSSEEDSSPFSAIFSALGGGEKKEGGRGGLLPFFNKKKQTKERANPPAASPIASMASPKPKDLDIEVVKAAVSNGALHVYVICESTNTNACTVALEKYASEIPCTVVSPEDGVNLQSPDSKWSSLRPQDLEGELTQPVAVVSGSSSREETDDDALITLRGKVKIEGDLSRHDLAEVCLQCALRLDRDEADGSSGGTRIVRVIPGGSGSVRMNADYFSRTGGKKAKERAGTVTSVDWGSTLACFGDVRDFPSI